MSDSDNYLKILEKISEVKEDVGVLKSEGRHLKEDLSEVRREISSIKEQDIHQNKLLDEHIAGVQSAHKRLDLEIEARKSEKQLLVRQMREINLRLERAETPSKVIRGSGRFLKWFAGIAAAAVAIAEYFRHS